MSPHPAGMAAKQIMVARPWLTILLGASANKVVITDRIPNYRGDQIGWTNSLSATKLEIVLDWTMMTVLVR